MAIPAFYLTQTLFDAACEAAHGVMRDWAEDNGRPRARWEDQSRDYQLAIHQLVFLELQQPGQLVSREEALRPEDTDALVRWAVWQHYFLSLAQMHGDAIDC